MNSVQAIQGFSDGCGSCRSDLTADCSRGGRGQAGQKQLSEEELREVQELKGRDREVRAHEAAHIAAGGGHVRGGASYEYQTGPDGQRYAVGGEVSIDTAAVEGDPEATIRKMQAVRKAALAPAHPSAQDRSVASRASQQEAKARQEIMRQRSENAEANGNPSASEAQTTSGYRPDGRPAAISSLDAHLLDISA